MSYERLDISAFGKRTLEIQDLDPVYNVLVEFVGVWSREQLNLWLLSYWSFYDIGLACWMSERQAGDFWQAWREAGENATASPLGDRWPRGHERRHMRGLNAQKTYASLMRRYEDDPGRFVEYCCRPRDESEDTCAQIAGRVKDHVGFGPWMAFKIADMTERVLGRNVSFDRAEVFMFKDPKEAAIRLWREQHRLPETAKPKDEVGVISAVLDHLKTEFSDWQAPPRGDRPLGLQEYETILCKWKSHMNGAYPIGNDLKAIRQAASRWASCSETAAAFLEKTKP